MAARQRGLLATSVKQISRGRHIQLPIGALADRSRLANTRKLCCGHLDGPQCARTIGAYLKKKFESLLHL